MNADGSETRLIARLRCGDALGLAPRGRDDSETPAPHIVPARPQWSAAHQGCIHLVRAQPDEVVDLRPIVTL